MMQWMSVPMVHLLTVSFPSSVPHFISTFLDAQGIVQDRAALMRTSVIIAMVMLLKAYLKTRYALSEEWANWVIFATCILMPHHLSKCSKFVVGKKSAIGDKPATKRNDTSISWERLPFATTPLLTTNDADEQKTRVRVLCRCLAFVLTSFLSSWKFGMKMAWQLNPTMTSYKSHPPAPE